MSALLPIADMVSVGIDVRGLGLATRGKTVGDQGDLEALRDIEGRIEDELRRLEKMEKHNEGTWMTRRFNNIGDVDGIPGRPADVRSVDLLRSQTTARERLST